MMKKKINKRKNKNCKINYKIINNKLINNQKIKFKKKSKILYLT